MALLKNSSTGLLAASFFLFLTGCVMPGENREVILKTVVPAQGDMRLNPDIGDHGQNDENVFSEENDNLIYMTIGVPNSSPDVDIYKRQELANALEIISEKRGKNVELPDGIERVELLLIIEGSKSTDYCHWKRHDVWHCHN